LAASAINEDAIVVELQAELEQEKKQQGLFEKDEVDSQQLFLNFSRNVIGGKPLPKKEIRSFQE